MRYRALTATGDMTFGAGQANFLIDSPEAVAQAVQTRLRLLRREWFLDTSEGTPYADEVMGTNTAATRDQAIRKRILGTQGVTGIVKYASQVVGREFHVQATISTRYGQITLQAVL